MCVKGPQPFMLVLSGMSPQSQKRRNGLHTQFFYIPPRSHASRCASGNFGSGSSKPCRHRSYGQRRLRPGTLCRREQQANAEREADSGRQHALHRKEACPAAIPGPLQQHPRITHHLSSSDKPRDRESGSNWCTIYTARPVSLRYLPAHDR